jgi:hypothetical protein
LHGTQLHAWFYSQKGPDQPIRFVGLSRGNQLALQDLNNPPLLIVCPEAENLEFKPGQSLCDVAGLRQRLAELLA